MSLPPIEQDPRFAEAVALLEAGEYFDASELFEDLFFEATGDELEFARLFLQLSVGLLHAERGQRAAADGRLEEAALALGRIEHPRGLDLDAVREQIRVALAAVRDGQRRTPPRVSLRDITER